MLDTSACPNGRSPPPLPVGLLFAVALAYPRGMGLGDVKLAAVDGPIPGPPVAPALLIAFFAGSLFGLALIAGHGAEARKQAVPFGPFLALGGVIAPVRRRPDRRLVPEHVLAVDPSRSRFLLP